MIGTTRKILIVDDAPEILTIVSKWLTSAGYRVFTPGDPLSTRRERKM